MSTAALRSLVATILAGLMNLALPGAPSVASPAPGDLDPSFGTGGVALAPIGINSMAFDVTTQPDGKLVAVGATFNSTIFDGAAFAVARFDADGSLDPTFGTVGVTTTPIGIPTTCCDILETHAKAVAVQADGKIVVAGKAMVAIGPVTSAALVRYESDGTLDVTFGIGGILIEPAVESFEDVLIQTDGHIVAAGSSVHGALVNTGAIARYDSTGSRDATFGTGGVVVTPDLRTIEMLGDGRLVAAGGTGGVGNGDFWLGRFLSSGATDETFGTAGEIVTDFGGSEIAQAISIDPSGTIVVGGGARSSDVLDYSEIRVARYGFAGALDVTFDTDGKVQTFVGNPTIIPTPPFVIQLAAVNALATQPDGSILVGGTLAYDFYGFSIPFVFTLARLAPDGSLDTSFDSHSVASLSAVSAMAFQPGALVVAGWSGPISTPIELGLARHVLDGDSWPPCGNGILDLGEDCDGGNVSAGSCCSASCEFQSVGSPCAPGSACLAGSTCDGAGSCTEAPPVPAMGCKLTVGSAAGRLILKSGVKGVPKLTWKWKKGEETLLGDFADPAGRDDYTLCLFNGQTATAFEIPAGGTCAGSPCWRDRPKGPQYKDRDTTPHGVRTVVLKAGAAGHASIILKGKGANLNLPTFPIDLPAVVQLHAESGACWESTFETSGMRKNDLKTFVGTSSIP